jgi:hypothetical protein
LWQELARSGPGRSAALVTDIGNDLLYDEPVARILSWVDECLDRLAAQGAQTVVTPLPVDNLQRLSRARFTLLRTILFPHCRLGLETCIERALALNEGVRRLARGRGVTLAEQRAEWYGFDPVHIRRARREAAWREVMGHWIGHESDLSGNRVTVGQAVYLRSRAPHQRRLLGLEQRRLQPSGHLASGTTVAIY